MEIVRPPDFAVTAAKPAHRPETIEMNKTYLIFCLWICQHLVSLTGLAARTKASFKFNKNKQVYNGRTVKQYVTERHGGHYMTLESIVFQPVLNLYTIREDTVGLKVCTAATRVHLCDVRVHRNENKTRMSE